MRIQDSHGRASFAVLALVVLLLANLSVAYLFEVESEEAVMASQSIEISLMRECSVIVNREVEVAAHYIAMATIRTATQELHNQTKVNELFSESFERFVAESFPRETRGVSVAIDDYSIIVVTEAKLAKEVVRTASVSDDHVDGEYPDIIETGEPGAMEEVGRTAYYRLIGQVNYTLSRGKTVLLTREDLASNVDSPFPFLNSQLGRFHLSTAGAMSHGAQALRYILTTVVQQRVLLGYAGGEYGRPGTGIASILTAQDVEMAVNLVLVLEQLRLFRSVDAEAVSMFDRAYFEDYAGAVSEPLLPSASNRTLTRLLDIYAGNGTLDPADLFVLFTAMDKDDLPINKVIAQALYAMIDQFSLKYLDYLDFLPLEFLANLGLTVLELFSSAFDDFISWLTDHQREADMVREFVRYLFSDLGYSTTILGPASVSLPAQEYRVTNEDGQEYNISIPAQTYPVPFKTRPLLEGHNGVWGNYFGQIYKNDLKAVHDGVRDLARDVARRLGNDLQTVGLFQPVRLNGFIEPRDKVAALEYLDAAVRKSLEAALEGMRENPRFYQGLVTNLWEREKATIRGLVNYIEQTYDVVSEMSLDVLFAHCSLVTSIVSVSTSDPDFVLLDSRARDTLETMITIAVSGNRWDLLAYERARINDVQRFENLYSKAVDLDTPPESGGLYQRMMEMVSGTSGLLRQAGGFLEVFLSGLMRNEKISDDKILFPADGGSFEFRNPGFIDNTSEEEQRRESLEVNQTPNLLTISRLTEEGREPEQEPSEGDLFVDILPPNHVPSSKESPNIHYTQIDGISTRPYETQWTISLKGAVRVRVQTSRAVYLDPAGVIPVVDELTVPLNATLTVKAFSGWPLTDVDYSDSNTLGGDLWELIRSFLESAWDSLGSAFGWILDGAKFLLDQLSGILDYLISQAAKVLNLVYDIIDKVLEILQDALKGLVSHLLEALDFVLERLPSFEFKLSLFGLTIRFAVNGDVATRLMLEATLGSFSLAVRFVNLEKAGIAPLQNWTKWDIFANLKGELGSFSLDGCLDPLMVVGDRILRVNARWANLFRLDLAIPEIETYRIYGFGVAIPIPAPPVGTIDVELGFRVRTSEPIEIVDVIALIAASFDEALRECGGLPVSTDDLIVCVVIFLRDFTGNLLETASDELQKIIDVTFYVDAAIVVGGVAGIGGSASFTIQGEGLVELLEYIADNAQGLIDCIFGDCSIQIDDLPNDIASHLFLTTGVFISASPPAFIPLKIPGGGNVEVSMSFCIGANIALMGRLVGADLGPWRIEFGMVMKDLPAAWMPTFFDPDAERFDLWIFKGTVTAP